MENEYKKRSTKANTKKEKEKFKGSYNSKHVRIQEHNKTKQYLMNTTFKVQKALHYRDTKQYQCI